MNISDMPAVAELDRLVDEIVFKRKWSDARWAGFYEDGGRGHYSTNIAHAMEALEHLKPKELRMGRLNTGRWYCNIDWQTMNECADTLAHAISKAELVAVEAKP